MSEKGKIVRWNHKKGFGFIQPVNDKQQIFVHITEFKDRSRAPRVGEMIKYTVSTDSEGRTCATKASRASEKSGNMPMMIIAGVVVVAAIAAAVYYFV